MYLYVSLTVIGCPEYRAPENMWMTEHSDHVTLGCAGTGEKWIVRCQGNNWKGDVGECPYSKYHTSRERE